MAQTPSCDNLKKPDRRVVGNNTNNPCRDSLFVSLKNKKASEMTAFEQIYFERKYAECYGTGERQVSGNAPEWITATLMIAFGVLASYYIIKYGLP